MHQITQTVRFVIANIEKITGGTSNSHTFDQSGGSIGSSTTDTWFIREGKNPSVSAHHFRVEFIDGRFCIREIQGDIYLNGSTAALGKRKITALHDGDSFLMGNYNIRALLSNASKTDANIPIGQMSLEEVLANGDADNSTQIVDQFIDSVEANPAVKPQKQDQSHRDILEFYEMNQDKRNKADPLLALEEEEKIANTARILAQSNEKENAEPNELETQRDISATTQASFTDKGISTNQFSDIESELQRMESGFSSDYVSSGKDRATDFSHRTLNRVENTTYQATVTGEGKAMSDEMTTSLHVAIAGLKMLYVNDEKKGIKPALSSIPLQPIEDNPIRLDHSLQQTMDMFYSGKTSPVFLSAPAAIKESLDNIKHDQLATEKAIAEALQELLQALSPQTLLQRFQRYAARNNTENPDAWAWKMYGHYYQELMMGRQNGFNRLFQELFAQSYDREMRRLQKDSDKNDNEARG